MAEETSKISTFTTRVRQLILHCKQLETENERLRGVIAESDKHIADMESQLLAAKEESASLKAARLLEVADGDIEMARKRVASLIRSVNKCITLLSEK